MHSPGRPSVPSGPAAASAANAAAAELGNVPGDLPAESTVVDPRALVDEHERRWTEERTTRGESAERPVGGGTELLPATAVEAAGEAAARMRPTVEITGRSGNAAPAPAPPAEGPITEPFAQREVSGLVASAAAPIAPPPAAGRAMPSWPPPSAAAPPPPPAPRPPPARRQAREDADSERALLGASDDDEDGVRGTFVDDAPIANMPTAVAPGYAPRRPSAGLPELPGRISITAGSDRGREFTLAVPEATIGRGTDNDIVLTDIAVSRRHAAFLFDGRRYVVRDLGSGNGTLVNGIRITGEAFIHDGDQIEIGNTLARFVHPVGVMDHPPPPAGPDIGAALPLVAPPSSIFDSPALPGHPPLAAGAGGPAGFPGGSPALAPTMAAPPPYGPQASPASAMGPTLGGKSPAFAATIGPASLGGGPNGPGPAMPGGAPMGPMAGPPNGPAPGLGATPPVGASPWAMATASVSAPRSPYTYSGTSSPEVFDLRPSRRKALLLGVGAAGAVALGVAVAVAVSASGGTSRPATSTEASAGVTNVPDDPGGRPGTTGAKRDAGPGAVALRPVPVDASPGSTIVAVGPPADAAAATTPPDDPPPDRPTGVAPDAGGTDPPRTPRRPDRPDPRPDPKAAASAAERTAAAQYKDRQFDRAAATLKAAASRTSGKTAERLNGLAGDYAAVGSALSRAGVNASSSPGAAMAAYQEALRLDARAGKGVHAGSIRAQLAKLAPRAAAAHMAAGRLEQAKAACDAAVNYGVGTDAQVARVRGQLEGKARELYTQGKQLEAKKPAEAKALWRRVLKIVPADSPWYGKAYAALNRPGANAHVDEDE